MVKRNKKVGQDRDGFRAAKRTDALIASIFFGVAFITLALLWGAL